VYVVTAQLGAQARFGEPRALFLAGDYANSGNEAFHDLSPDGRQFVMVRPIGAERTPTLHVVMHHFDQPATGRGTP